MKHQRESYCLAGACGGSWMAKLMKTTVYKAFSALILLSIHSAVRGVGSCSRTLQQGT